MFHIPPKYISCVSELDSCCGFQLLLLFVKRISYKLVNKCIVSSPLDRYVFRSGAPEHPGDKFYNTTVEILPEDHVNKKEGVLDNMSHSHQYRMTDDLYLVVGEFIGTSGVAEGMVNRTVGKVAVLRLVVQYPSASWVILNEVS